MIKSSNPALKPFQQPQTWADYTGSDVAGSKPTTMTLGGTVQAAGIQLGIVALMGMLTWVAFSKEIIPMGAAMPIWLVGIIGGVILSMIMSRKPHLARVLGPIYCVLNGVFVGAISFTLATMLGHQLMQNPGLVGGTSSYTLAQATERGSVIVFQALLATIGVVGVLLAGYRMGFLRVRGVFAKVVIGATAGMFFVVLVGFALSMFGVGVPLFGTGPIGIAFTAVMAVLASLNVVMAFQTVEDGIANGMPKYFEWYAGFALVSTIVWLYVEILILLFKIYSSMNRD